MLMTGDLSVGTWTQKSSVINPRNPFKKDSALLEYGYDSDEDWEEEEIGEDLNAVSDEEEEEDEEGSEVCSCVLLQSD